MPFAGAADLATALSLLGPVEGFVDACDAGLAGLADDPVDGLFTLEAIAFAEGDPPLFSKVPVRDCVARGVCVCSALKPSLPFAEAL